MLKLWTHLESKVRADEGEVASWLILAAGLCAAAAVASGILNETIQGLAEAVG